MNTEVKAETVKPSLSINAIMLSRAIVALELLIFSRILVFLVVIVCGAILINEGFSRGLILVASLIALAGLLFGQWLRSVAVGILNDRLWASVVVAALLIGYDAQTYRRIILGGGNSNIAGAVSSMIELNSACLLYWFCRIRHSRWLR